jgi:hypothetical protein
VAVIHIHALPFRARAVKRNPLFAASLEFAMSEHPVLPDAQTTPPQAVADATKQGQDLCRPLNEVGV